MSSRIRRYKRFTVANMDVRARALFTAEVELLNISTSGACVLSKTSLKLGENCLIKLEREGALIPLRCTVVWETLCGSERGTAGEVIPLYKSGIEFRNISSNRLVELKDFIRVTGLPDELKLGDQYGPSALRFRVRTHEKALLYYPGTSVVKKISLGGMLMELYRGIPIENRLPMALLLPGENRPIKFQGRVAYCAAMDDMHSKRFDIGIEFLGMAENDRSRVSGFLHLLEQPGPSKASPRPR